MASLNDYTPFDSNQVEELKVDFNTLNTDITELENNSDLLESINPTFNVMEELYDQFNLLLELKNDETVNDQYNNRIASLSSKRGIIAEANNGLPIIENQSNFSNGSLWLILES